MIGWNLELGGADEIVLRETYEPIDERGNVGTQTVFCPEDLRELVAAVRAKSQQPRVHVQLRCYDSRGAANEAFAKIAASYRLTLALADLLVEQAARYDLDGFHLDWEGPTLTPGQRARNFAAMVRRISTRFASERSETLGQPLALSLSAIGRLDAMSRYTHDLAHNVDFIILMTYGSKWAEIELDRGAVQPLAAFTRGYFCGDKDPLDPEPGREFVPGPFPIAKLMLGVPLFGVQSDDGKSYHELIGADPAANAAVFEAPVDPRSGCSVAGTCHYLGKYALAQRARLILDAGGLGVAAFELRHDVFGKPGPNGSSAYDPDLDRYSLYYATAEYIEAKYGLDRAIAKPEE